MNTIDLKGDDQTFREIVARTIDSFVDDTLTTLGSYAFAGCTALTSIDLSAITRTGSYSFAGCTALISANLPAATFFGNSEFSGCTRLERVDLASTNMIGAFMFNNCSALTTLILRNTSQVASLPGTTVFNGANNAIIYVPDALVDSYKSATNWSSFADRIKGLSELPA